VSQSRSQKHIYLFGPFSLSRSERILMREGHLVEAEPKTVDTLIVFLERRGEVLTKEHLRMAIWGPQTFVEPNTVERQICVLRKILRAGSSEGVFIETIPKRGYRFVTPVVETGVTTTPRPPESSKVNAGSRARIAVQVISRVVPIAFALAIGFLLSWKYLSEVLMTR
jgi:DNA-binding winged helix-turn-helix (wHTH) protein